MAKQLLEALAQVINLKEGMAEISAGENLEAVLPPKVAKLLDVPDSATFTTAAGERKCQFVSYNSEIFQRCETLLGAEGSLSSFAVQYQGYLKQSGFDKLVTETLCPQNGLLRVGKATPSWTPYCLFNIAYTAEADEKRLGLVSFWLNGVTGVAGVDVGDALLWKSDRIEALSGQGRSTKAEGRRDFLKGDSDPATSFLPSALCPLPSERSDVNVPEDGQLKADWLWELAQQISQSQIEQEIAIWLLSLERKLNRDKRRIQEYYQTIISEIGAKCEKKKLEGEALEKELSRIKATKSEMSRKMADLQQRYALSITAQVHSLMVVWLQTVTIECLLIRKKDKRNVLAVYNPYTRIVEPIRCEITNLPVTRFMLDDTMQIRGNLS